MSRSRNETTQSRLSSDEQAFIRAVCESPADELIRLVYADWLEEQGRCTRAEYIRFEIEAERHLAGGGRIPSDYTLRRRATIMEGTQWVKELPQIPGVNWQNLFRGGFPSGAIFTSVTALSTQVDRILRTIPVWSATFQTVTEVSFVEAAQQGCFAQIREMDIYRGQIGSSGMAALCEPNSCEHIQKLILNYAGIEDDAVRLLARNGMNTKLRWLDLTGNPVNYSAIRELLESPNLPDLRYIVVDSTRVPQEEALAMQAILSQRSHFHGIPRYDLHPV